MLSKGCFLRVSEGRKGGYILKNAPEACTVGMILRQTKGSLAPVNYDDEYEI